jgi:nitrogen fixation/metabolism regulation signal transduction histidine kinase
MEVFGGFAHEIAQPLNAVMIAAQVVKLRVEKSHIPNEEQVQLFNRLDLIMSQVCRARDIVAEVRRLGQPSAQAPEEDAGLAKLFDKVMSLMEQQLISRGIEFKSEGRSVAYPPLAHPRIVEAVIAQVMAYARDAVQAADERLRAHGKKYHRSLQAELKDEGDRQVIRISWPPPRARHVSPLHKECDPELPEGGLLEDQPRRLGVVAADSVLSRIGGALEITGDSIRVAFPVSG